MPTGIPDIHTSKMREKNPNWKGGQHISSHGYVKILVGSEHHLADSQGYAYEHQIVMEKILGRHLGPNEIVHHIDGNNVHNIPENLQLVTGNAEHYYLHRSPSSNLRKPHETNTIISCKCGCGGTFWRYDKYGRPRFFISGHNRRNYASN